MDRERAFEAEFHPEKVYVEADPLIRLMNHRTEMLDRCLARIDDRGRSLTTLTTSSPLTPCQSRRLSGSLL